MFEDELCPVYVGLDWAAEVHAVCVLDHAGKKLASFTIEHSRDGIASLIARLATYGDPADVQIGIERPNGRLVDLLLEAGHPVIPVSPNAIKAWREGEEISGAKSDAGDAMVIAEYLRLRNHRLSPVPPYSSQTKALRTVVRSRDDLVQLRVAATNQLDALLDAYWPGAKAIFADTESPISLAFLRRYPTALDAAHLGEKRLATFTTKNGLLRPPPSRPAAHPAPQRPDGNDRSRALGRRQRRGPGLRRRARGTQPGHPQPPEVHHRPTRPPRSPV